MTDKRTLNHLPRPAPVKKLRFGTISQDRDPWLRGHKTYGEATAVVLLNGYDVPPSTCLLCLQPWIMTAIGPGQKTIFL